MDVALAFLHIQSKGYNVKSTKTVDKELGIKLWDTHLLELRWDGDLARLVVTVPIEYTPGAGGMHDESSDETVIITLTTTELLQLAATINAIQSEWFSQHLLNGKPRWK